MVSRIFRLGYLVGERGVVAHSRRHTVGEDVVDVHHDAVVEVAPRVLRRAVAGDDPCIGVEQPAPTVRVAVVVTQDQRVLVGLARVDGPGVQEVSDVVDQTRRVIPAPAAREARKGVDAEIPGSAETHAERRPAALRIRDDDHTVGRAHRDDGEVDPAAVVVTPVGVGLQEVDVARRAAVVPLAVRHLLGSRLRRQVPGDVERKAG
jgi:hypothetical protein